VRPDVVAGALPQVTEPLAGTPHERSELIGLEAGEHVIAAVSSAATGGALDRANCPVILGGP